MSAFVTAILDVLFPPVCAACSEALPSREQPSRELELCVVCDVTLEPLGPACRRCGMPGGDVPRCGSCALEPPEYDGASAVWLYGGAIAELLHRYKYEQQPALARPLGRMLATLELPHADVVTHVPLHAKRRRARTYDQALYLAQVLAKERGLPCESLLVRRRATGRQVGRVRTERQKNVSDAFEVRRDVSDRAVWLVDDVVTTGATAGECARVLLDAGARSVHVVSVARAA